ncbi:MAG: choice-of-anchor Q domain-containing protein [Myxococcota bacterium]
MQRIVLWSPVFLAFVLSPAFLQINCERSGDPALASLELEASGIDRVANFAPNTLRYDAWVDGAATMTLRAQPMEPAAKVKWTYGAESGRLTTGTGEVSIPVLADSETLFVFVSTTGGALRTYSVAIDPPCSAGDCDDRNPCSTDTCTASQCEFVPAPDGTLCDEGAGSCSSGACNPGRFPCTEAGLRAAAAAGGGPNTFACTEPTNVQILSPLVIDEDVILDGGGALTVRRPGAASLAVSVQGANAQLIGMTLIGIIAANDASLELNDTTVLGLTELRTSTATLTNATLSYPTGVALSVIDSSVSIQGSLLEAGGFALFTQGSVAGVSQVDVLNSTLFGKVRSSHSSGTLSFRHATVAGDVDGVADTVSFENSLLLGACVVPALTSGHNIVQGPNTCFFPADATDAFDVDEFALRLTALQDNGGPTRNYLPTAGSAAIDQIPLEDCVDVDGAPVAVDQRGVVRPQGLFCDVGAVEAVQP